MIDEQSLKPYLNILPLAIIALVSALLLTPLIGFLAKKYNFVDLPAKLRKRTDITNAQRIHDGVKPRLGGLAVLIPLIILTLTQIPLSTEIFGIILGLVILLISGIIDDRLELSAGKQLFIQLLVAVIVVITGTTIKSVDFAYHNYNFVASQSPLTIGSFTYMFRFPADLITIFWILAITNALNWVSGIDALGEAVAFIAATITMMLAIKTGQYELALIPAFLSGGLLGFIPYNFPPAKIFSGTSGNTGYGFIIAVLAILSGSKITTTILVLSLPIVDMLWVIIYRLRTQKDIPFLKRPFVGGDVHLHHRLMALGLSIKQTLIVETLAMTLISLFAFYLGGFSISVITLVVVIAVLIIFFIVLSVKIKKNGSKNQQKANKPPTPHEPAGPTPEEKYAY